MSYIILNAYTFYIYAEIFRSKVEVDYNNFVMMIFASIQLFQSLKMGECGK